MREFNKLDALAYNEFMRLKMQENAKDDTDYLIGVYEVEVLEEYIKQAEDSEKVVVKGNTLVICSNYIFTYNKCDRCPTCRDGHGKCLDKFDFKKHQLKLKHNRDSDRLLYLQYKDLDE